MVTAHHLSNLFVKDMHIYNPSLARRGLLLITILQYNAALGRDVKYGKVDKFHFNPFDFPNTKLDIKSVPILGMHKC